MTSSVTKSNEALVSVKEAIQEAVQEYPFKDNEPHSRESITETIRQQLSVWLGRDVEMNDVRWKLSDDGKSYDIYIPRKYFNVVHLH